MRDAPCLPDVPVHAPLAPAAPSPGANPTANPTADSGAPLRPAQNDAMAGDAPGPDTGARLVCVIEGARDPNLLVRLVAELARRSRVPETLTCGPLPGRPDSQSVALEVALSGTREAAHLARRFASWPCVTRVRTLAPT
ncbi:hypothetical protein [Roseospira visakhapatnamensis]|uniref:ACT domain-containing protein n=1 Tax=Roseospira visakhapatnamensis TaxID=390880 RepID=A0A7W6WB83_9PROT|nr:hypothetical protein [Roseospira visakhapatnamensis]MBB4267558.1 hypothetical protein [Roseospira visakhapatnamensis]